jgi:pyruvate dehydrogenase E2 component (dihydrolipoamide acetyltransferase)
MWGEHSSPQVLGFDDVDMTEAHKLIEDIKEAFDVKVTATHLTVATIAAILKNKPHLNAVRVGGRAMQRKDVDIFVQVAVGVGDKADLSGIKIRNADTKNVIELAEEISDRARKVRKGEDKDIEQSKRLADAMPSTILRQFVNFVTFLSFDAGMDLTKIGVKPDPFGSVMVSNVAPFGVHAGFAPLIPAARTPIIILIGRTDPKPVVIDGEIVIRPIQRMTATFDHRLLDGYQIGVICSELKVRMEGCVEMRKAVFG